MRERAASESWATCRFMSRTIAPTSGPIGNIFDLDQQGNPTVVSGVPPDYFSKTGQLWGNPIYRWDVLAADGYRWWLDRFRATLEMVDMIRLDHFRGFEAYWEVPAGRDDRSEWAMGEGSGSGAFPRGQSEAGRAAAGGGEPRRDHARSGSDPRGVRLSGHGGAAVCLRNRSSGAHVSPAQLSARGGGVHAARTITTRRWDGGGAKDVARARGRTRTSGASASLRDAYLNTDGRRFIGRLFAR